MSETIGTIADTLTILLAIAALMATIIRRLTGVRKRVLGREVRRIAHHARPALQRVHGTDDPLDLLADGAAAGALAENLVDAMDPSAFDAADVLAEVLSRATRGSLVARRPAITDQLLAVARGIHAPGSFGLLTRAMYPTETAGLRTSAGRLEDHLGRFEGGLTVDPARQHLGWPGEEDRFGRFVTLMSGAPILGLATANKARLAATTLVWHNRRYRGLADGEQPTLMTGRYDDAHASGHACGAWVARPDGPGPFDQRLLDVRAVEMIESHAKGFSAFVLHTTETCYAVSELGTSVGCKKIPVDAANELPALDVAGDGRVDLDNPQRVSILTSYAAILTCDDQLLLAERSGRNANGNDVLSATTGGVMNHDEPGHTGDVDAWGMPSPTVGLAREAREEIGIDLPENAFLPVCVFLSNVRGRPRADAEQGQVVTCVLHLATVDATAADVQRWMATRSDLAHGRFEQRALVSVDTTSPQALATFAATHATELDQHGLLSCLMTAAVLHGEQATRSAFEAAFDQLGGPGTSTWTEVSPWPDTGWARTLVDVDRLYPGPTQPGAPAASGRPGDPGRSDVPA